VGNVARKGWNSLSAGYKARLEKAGISKSDYESGQSIQSARGHAKTPERPTQAHKFPVYQAQRSQLVNAITAKKQAYFGTRPIWNPKRAAAKFRKEPPPMAALKRWATLTKEEWLDAIREDHSAAAYLGYH